MSCPRLGLVGLLLFTAGCVGHQSALGFRARQAVLKSDAAAFKELMEEAAETTPAGPLDNPEKTVLTHFLDLAGDPLFFPYVEEWMQKGWVGEDMRCAVYRAHYRAEEKRNPEVAQASAQKILDLARAAAPDAERQWEVDVCLSGAPFLTVTATAALLPYLKLAADPTEPIRFRAGLLDGMTNAYLTGAERLYGNQPELTREEAQALARKQASDQATRTRFVLEAVRPYVESAFLASATARGVLEVENVLVPLGQSFVGRYAESEDPYEHDLAWAWVRAIKAKKKIPRIMGLGLWNRNLEPKADVDWYLCARPGPAPTGSAGALGPVKTMEALAVRSPSGTPPPNLEARCDGFPERWGPYPLEATARARLAERHSEGGERVAVLLKKRVIEGPAEASSEEPEE